MFAGEALVDVVMRVPALPERGGDLLASSAEVTAGGGFNVMAAAARQGLPVLYAGGHGTGPWGDMVRAAWTRRGSSGSGRASELKLSHGSFRRSIAKLDAAFGKAAGQWPYHKQTCPIHRKPPSSRSSS